ncbi:hypothetical protein IT396_01405 [Candidatus Nomurabacteria bacterium]|nr:hypothetical protein [Candidatus Nomurabacteria bacterium]
MSTQTTVLLNLGCGFKKYPGYINVDSAPECQPDVVWDLEKTPWPWEDSSVDEVKLEHTLEHLGETTAAYLNIWKELYRICKNGAVIDITVPHWNHENFAHDPTHKRPITPVGIAMFDQARNIQMAEQGIRETKLGLFTGVDIDLQQKDVNYSYTQKIATEVEAGRLTMNDLEHLQQHQNNICVEITMKPRVVKPARGAAWLAAQGHNPGALL